MIYGKSYKEDNTVYDNQLINFISDSYEDIINIHLRDFNFEDIKGKSAEKLKAFYYYLCFYYGLTIYYDYNISKLEWSEFVEVEDLNSISKCFSCLGISLNKVLNSIGLPKVEDNLSITNNGIEYFELESTFVIEEEDSVLVYEDVEELFGNLNYCINLIDINCGTSNIELLTDENPTINPSTNMYRVYYGTSSLTTLTEVEALTFNYLDKVSYLGNYSFSSSNYKYFCIHSSFGSYPNGFIDIGTGLSVVMSPVYTIYINGDLYFIYRSLNIIGSSLIIEVI